MNSLTFSSVELDRVPFDKLGRDLVDLHLH